MSEQTDRFWRRVLAEIDDGGFFDRPVAHDRMASGAIEPFAFAVGTHERLLAEEMVQPAPLAADGYPNGADQEWLDYTALLYGGWPPPPLTPEARLIVIFALLLLLILFVVEVVIVLSVGS